VDRCQGLLLFHYRTAAYGPEEARPDPSLTCSLAREYFTFTYKGHFVIPAEAGSQPVIATAEWIPVVTGMTDLLDDSMMHLQIRDALPSFLLAEK